MKNTLMHTMIAAAALVVAAGSASAQTYRADVPVAFQVGNKPMAAGTYDFDVISGAAGRMVVVRNRSTHNSAALVANQKSDAPKAWVATGAPRIEFSCTGDACSVAKLWNGIDSSAYGFAVPKTRGGNFVAQRSAVVTLSMIKVR